MKQMFLLLLASLSTGPMCCGGEPPKASELGRFGGWQGKQSEATGFFRTEHDGERWWLVTPEGNAFLSLGINHYHPGWWMQDENRDHWVKAFGAKQPGDDAWRGGFRDEAVRDCRHLGLNTFGYHCETPMLLDPPLRPVMPYVRHYVPVAFSLHMRAKSEAYVDVFDPSFAEHYDGVAREQVKPYADDPLILGFAMADVPTIYNLAAVQGPEGKTLDGENLLPLFTQQRTSLRRASIFQAFRGMTERSYRNQSLAQRGQRRRSHRGVSQRRVVG